MENNNEIEKLEILAKYCKKFNVVFSGVESSAILAAMDEWKYNNKDK